MNKLPQSEARELIATKLMGWRKKAFTCDHWVGEAGNVVAPKEWNPYKSEDDFRMVLEKIMEDKNLIHEYIELFTINKCPRISVTSYMKATLPERVDAVVAVLSDSQKKDD